MVSAFFGTVIKLKHPKNAPNHDQLLEKEEDDYDDGSYPSWLAVNDGGNTINRRKTLEEHAWLKLIHPSNRQIAGTYNFQQIRTSHQSAGWWTVRWGAFGNVSNFEPRFFNISVSPQCTVTVPKRRSSVFVEIKHEPTKRVKPFQSQTKKGYPPCGFCHSLSRSGEVHLSSSSWWWNCMMCDMLDMLPWD